MEAWPQALPCLLPLGFCPSARLGEYSTPQVFPAWAVLYAQPHGPPTFFNLLFSSSFLDFPVLCCGALCIEMCS
jgi:hypothetical protein